jgi:hypothetical protein
MKGARTYPGRRRVGRNSLLHRKKKWEMKQEKKKTVRWHRRTVRKRRVWV